MDKVYVVCGDTGEYSDYNQWLVEAYLTEDAAKARVMELEQLLLALGFTKSSKDHRIDWPEDWDYNYDEEEKYAAAIGCEFHCTYNGVRWYYTAVPLKNS